MKKISSLLFLTLFLAACTWNNGVPNVEVNLKEELSPEIKEDYSIFYLGYGSNMNIENMDSRCGQDNFVDLGKVILFDYEFYFYDRGYANVRPVPDKYVEGVLYKINEQCLAGLDRAEGYPNVYQRGEVSLNYKDDIIKAEVYLVIGDNTRSRPSDSYYDTVIQGAREHNLSAAYLDYIDFMAGR